MRNPSPFRRGRALARPCRAFFLRRLIRAALSPRASRIASAARSRQAPRDRPRARNRAARNGRGATGSGHRPPLSGSRCRPAVPADRPPASPPPPMSRPAARASVAAATSASTSRRPRLSPCAPIGGKACAASPISASRSPMISGTICRAIGTIPGRLSSRMAPSSERACRSISRASSASGNACRRCSLRIRHQPDEARPVWRGLGPGQGNEGEGAGAGVEFGGEIAVRQAMGQKHGQRALRIASRPDRQSR